MLLTCGFCNSFFRLEFECILPGGELVVSNGYSLGSSIDLSVDEFSRELNPNETGPEDLNSKIVILD